MPALDSNQLEQDLEVIERNIRTLETRYADYFEGVIANEPKEMRTNTEALVQRWWGKPIPNTMLRFRLQNVVQRYKSYKEKWDRQLRVKMKNDREEPTYE
jgi:hypothetical protein